MTLSHSDAYTRLMQAYRSPFGLADVPTDTPLLLGLSGGADSRLLLHLLAQECKAGGATLHLAHVHHGIRGQEADRDEQFCRDLAREYQLPLHVLHADVPLLAKEAGKSLETMAREVRYDYFSRIMTEHDIPLLITAHHADDNLETVLFHLVRGCGLAGLAGIAPVRSLSTAGQRVVRPLLGCSKADIVAACDHLNLTYVTDTTNSDVAYSRNRLRAQVTPALAAITPHPEQKLLHTCACLREDDQLLCSLAEDFLTRELMGDTICRTALAQAHPAIAKRALRLWVQRLCGQLPEACHIDAVLALCKAPRSSRHIHIVGGLVALTERRVLRILPASQCQDTSQAVPDFRLPFQMGVQEDAELGLRITVTPIARENAASCSQEKNTKNDINVYKPFIRDTLTFDTIDACTSDGRNTDLYWRRRRASDTLRYRGVNRSLRKLQNELGIPPHLRDRLPLLCCGDTVLWAPLIGTCDNASATTGCALCLTIEILPDKTDYITEETL